MRIHTAPAPRRGSCYPPRFTRVSGIALLECLVYISVLVVILGVAGAAFFRCWDNSLGLVRNAGDIERALDAGERWRADVRAAIQAPRLETAGAEEILRLGTGRGEVLYSFSNGQVRRRAGESGPWIVLLPTVKSSRMLADTRSQAAAWRWELELAAYRKGAHIRPLFTFEAVPAPPTPP